ncbi:MAG: hypothetical protein JO257_07020 [Deltaproteobacteria bacterium]|nr:hypothetical protein [Deltaproteobacteria bacterium]
MDSRASSDAPPGVDACESCIAPVNDLPGGAIDVSAGGDFTADLTYAHDDASKPNTAGNLCGGTGGLDVFYTVTLAADEVVYLDTFGSDFDTVIRVFHGACAAGAAPGGVVCHDNANNCSSVQTVWLGTMKAGANCIVVDGLDGTQTGHSLKLRVERGHRNGGLVTPSGVIGSASYSQTGDTTGATNVEDGSCAQHMAGENGFAFSMCPGVTKTVTASTCNQASATAAWDTAIWSRGPAGELACADDDGANCVNSGGLSTISFTASENHLYWVLVDGGSANVSGAYQVDFNFQ